MTQAREIAAIVAVALTVSACAHVPRATENGVLKDFWPKISSRDHIRVRGVGAARAQVSGEKAKVQALALGTTGRRGQARNAALVAARQQLLAVVSGVKIEGGVTIAQMMEKDSLVRELANDMVQGGEEILTEWTRDSGCVVTIELKRSTVERLIQQKSHREKDLEKRLAKAVAESKKLDGLVTALGTRRFDSTDARLIRWKAEETKAIIEHGERLDRRIDRFDGANGSESIGILNDIIDLSNRIERFENQPSDREIKKFERASWRSEVEICTNYPSVQCQESLAFKCKNAPAEYPGCQEALEASCERSWSSACPGPRQVRHCWSQGSTWGCE